METLIRCHILSVASDLGQHCLPMSHKKDAMSYFVYTSNEGGGGGGGGGVGSSYEPSLLGCVESTVKPVLRGHSKIDKTMILMTYGSLTKVERIAECSLWSILQYF